jgi:hypothetical protein
VAIFKPTGIRAMLVMGFYADRLGIPIGSQEHLDTFIGSLLRLGLQLVSVPYLEFDTEIAGWALEVPGDGRVVLAGPEPLRFASSAADPPGPWLDAVAEQKRAVVLMTTMVTGPGYLDDGLGDSAILDHLDRARRAGHLLGGVVPASAPRRPPGVTGRRPRPFKTR